MQYSTIIEDICNECFLSKIWLSFLGKIIFRNPPSTVKYRLTFETGAFGLIYILRPIQLEKLLKYIIYPILSRSIITYPIS